MFGFGPLEILLLVFVLVLFFGAKRIPAAMGSLGRGVREFKQGMKVEEDDAPAAPLPATPPPPPPLVEPAGPQAQPLRSLADAPADAGDERARRMGAGPSTEDPSGPDR